MYRKKIYNVFKTVAALEKHIQDLQITLDYGNSVWLACALMAGEILLLLFCGILHLIYTTSTKFTLFQGSVTFTMYFVMMTIELILPCQFLTVYNSAALMFSAINSKLKEKYLSPEDFRKCMVVYSKICNLLEQCNHLNTILILIAISTRFVTTTLNLYGLIINAFMNGKQTNFPVFAGIVLFCYKLGILIFVAEKIKSSVGLFH